MKTIIALALLCAATTASANHAVYTYGNPNSLQFCDSMEIRIGPDSLNPANYIAAQDCSALQYDTVRYVRHPYSRIDVILPGSRRYCSLVSHEGTNEGNTTTVIDCRPRISN
jgi:hypothetical protein